MSDRIVWIFTTLVTEIVSLLFINVTSFIFLFSQPINAGEKDSEFSNVSDETVDLSSDDKFDFIRTSSQISSNKSSMQDEKSGFYSCHSKVLISPNHSAIPSISTTYKSMHQ